MIKVVLEMGEYSTESEYFPQIPSRSDIIVIRHKEFKINKIVWEKSCLSFNKETEDYNYEPHLYLEELRND